VRKEIRDILNENDKRLERINAPFDPISGEGSIGERTKLCLSDFSVPEQYIPVEMEDEPLIKELSQFTSIEEYVNAIYEDAGCVCEDMECEIAKVSRKIIRIRIRYDFAFWAALLVKIKAKGGGADVHFILNRPQREKLVPLLESYRKAGMPIRLVLLKARQWGGSTCIQMYMAWLQLVHEVGLNSFIVGHVSSTSAEVEDMFKTMLENYPTELLYDDDTERSIKEEKWKAVGGKPNIHRVPQRKCKIKTGTAESPDSARGGDYNLVHCTEVGLWKKTEGKRPQDIMQSATKGMLYTAYTMIVLESTAKGVGNFFHREYMAARNKSSQYDSLFVAWFDIDQYSLDFKYKHGKDVPDAVRGSVRYMHNPDNLEEFAEWLYDHKDDTSAVDDRHESGAYLFNLWMLGATLQAIHWYIVERASVDDSGIMYSEYPSTDIEAFVNSGANVFDKSQVEKLRRSCQTPKFVGEVIGSVPLGGQGSTDGNNNTIRFLGDKRLLDDVKFVDDTQGHLFVWDKPDIYDGDEIMLNQYLVSVDVGGRGTKADWSVIKVIDRSWMLFGEKPVVVAMWVGHIDMDLLAWKAAQIARFYNDAMLVIESNTLETKDKDRVVDGDQTQFILLQIKEAYDNLYARKQSEEDIKEGAPIKYGFHTNVSTKPMVINTLIQAVREQAWTERDAGTLDELDCYERKQNGSYGAVIGQHDDRLMATAIALFICWYDMEMPKMVKRTASCVSRHKQIRILRP